MQGKEGCKGLSFNGRDLEKSLVTRNLSNLAHTNSPGHNIAYTEVNLTKCELKNITTISSFIHIRILDLKHNYLKTLEPLGNLNQLEELDASYNLLEIALDFLPPLRLSVVNLSNNNINNISFCKNNHYLESLDLSSNKITNISVEDVRFLKFLKYLNLSKNKIESINFFNHNSIIPLLQLDVSYNDSANIERLRALPFLKYLTLNNNKLEKLDFIDKVNCYIHELDLSNNKVSELAQINFLEKTKGLKLLNLIGCPVQIKPKYRQSVIKIINSLEFLDSIMITMEEKVEIVIEEKMYNDEYKYEDVNLNSKIFQDLIVEDL